MCERAALQDRWLKYRLDVLLPELMRRADVQMWIVVAREYNEGPVIETMLPTMWLSARRRTILVFYDRGPEAGVEHPAVTRYAIGNVFGSAWGLEAQPDQWRRLTEIVAEHDPASIALNRSDDFGLAAVLTYTEGEALLAALPEVFRERKLTAWFHPSVSVRRAERDGDFSARPEGDVIQPGDLLHVDFGITYLGLNTDTQQHTYVLRPGEAEAPEGLRRTIGVGNRLQDVLTGQFQAGRTGNEILKGALAQRTTKASTPPSTPTPSASTATPPSRRSGCGTSRVACTDRAATCSTQTRPTPSNSTPPCPPPSGAKRPSA